MYNDFGLGLRQVMPKKDDRLKEIEIELNMISYKNIIPQIQNVTERTSNQINVAKQLG